MGHKLYLIADNLRSAHNVGALLRLSEGLGVSEIFLCGITPYPRLKERDTRPPYLAEKINRRIAKTSLGAEISQAWSYESKTVNVLAKLQRVGVEIIGLEQDTLAIRLDSYKPKTDVALVVGNELDGISEEVLKLCSKIVEIPMVGKKESFNVSTAAAMALYYLTYAII
ncbi:MAG: TrmH family RNA methyltransferase [Candidatus Saccharimonadales bacterium]